MTLDEFTEECRNDVERFKAQWLAGREMKPDMWPIEMSEGDWFDQFITWVTGNTAQ